MSLRTWKTHFSIAALVLAGLVWLPGGGAFCAEKEATVAKQILAGTGVRGGVVVHLGCGSGELTAALRADDRYVVHGLDTDAGAIAKARQHIQSLGLYGPVSVERWDAAFLPYAENIVNLLVAESLGKVPMDEVMRVLAPLGVAYIKTNGKWEKAVKPWPKEIDEWTHFLHGADNNAVAHDTLVGPPRRMQWVAEPLWLRSHETPSGVPAVVSAKGRLFYIFDEGVIGIVDERLPQKWSLIARDAFNGALLWKQPISDFGWTAWSKGKYEGNDWTVSGPMRTDVPNTVPRRLVAEGDRVYVTLGFTAPVSVLDAATGKAVRTLEKTAGAEEILCSGGVVAVRIGAPQAEGNKRRGRQSDGGRLAAFDAASGKSLWDVPANGVVPLSPAIEGDRLFFQEDAALVGRSLKTGKELWRAPMGKDRANTLVVHDGVVVLSMPAKLSAFAAEDGKPLWSRDEGTGKRSFPMDLFVANGLVWRGIGGVGLDPKTGEVKKEIPTEIVKNLNSLGHHHRCYRNKATDQYIMSAWEGVEFLDLQGSGSARENWLRGSCRYGVMPCNGLLYTPPTQCFCEPGVKLLGFSALAAAAPAPRKDRLSSEAERLERGPAYEEISNLKSEIRNLQSAIPHSSDWPTYRHDAARSGHTQMAGPAALTTAWQAQLGGRISQPVVADGRVYVAAIDRHAVLAFSDKDGKPAWEFTAGGRVDSPPTIHKGLVLFGSADGWVYCLRASDGKMAWRFRAAPEERLVGAFGQLESAWPVHGSVLVQGGVAYVAAGRSSFLDGGIRLYGLDPVSGKKLSEARVEGPYADVSKGPGHSFSMEGARSEILVGDGSSVYMRQWQFDNKLALQETPDITKMGDKKMGLHLFATSELLDGSWYNRSYWMYSARWPGFYIANQAPKAGQILVFDETQTYAVNPFVRRNRHSPMFFPGKEGYLLFADNNDNEPGLVDAEGKPEPVAWLPQSDYARATDGKAKITLTTVAVDKDKWIGFTRSKPANWQTWVSIRPRAMVLAGKTLFIAGPPDMIDPKDPMGAFEGRKGASLWAVSGTDGKKIAEAKLDSEPVFDGLVAANGRLYMSTLTGQVVCMGGR